MKSSRHLTGDAGEACGRLEDVLKRYGSMVVAYSGGVDSGVLAYMASRVLPHSSLAVLAVSPSLSTRERDAAIGFLERHEIPHECIGTEELSSEQYRLNHPDRCYYCKSELFSRLGIVANRTGLRFIAYGANADDEKDFRPGSKAAREHHVIAPLLEAGIDKETVRKIARGLGLELWDKPSSPCLASRIPYYSEVDEEKLRQVEQAEYALEDLGFKVFRVRHHGDIARIELPLENRSDALREGVWEKLVERIKSAGFNYVTLDLEGFRSGRLNESIDGTGRPGETS